MADKPIKLTDAQLTTLQQVADPNYKAYRKQYWEHQSQYHHNHATLKVLNRYGLVELRVEDYSSVVYLTPEGRAYLDALGIAPIPLAPPPPSDKERIAALEAALLEAKTKAYLAWEAAIDANPNYSQMFSIAREGLVDVIEIIGNALGDKA